MSKSYSTNSPISALAASNYPSATRLLLIKELKPPKRNKRREKLFHLADLPSTQIGRRLAEGARVIPFVRINNHILRSRYLRSGLLAAGDRIHLIAFATKATSESINNEKQPNSQVIGRHPVGAAIDDTSLLVLTWLSKSMLEESRDSWELRVADVVGVSSSSKSLTDFTMGSFLWMSSGRGRNESLLIFFSSPTRARALQLGASATASGQSAPPSSPATPPHRRPRRSSSIRRCGEGIAWNWSRASPRKKTRTMKEALEIFCSFLFCFWVLYYCRFSFLF